MAGVKGRSGKHGDKIWRDALRLAISRKDNGEDKTIERLATKLVDLGLKGDFVALKEIGDRLDGKPAQSLVVGGDTDAPLMPIINVTIAPKPSPAS